MIINFLAAIILFSGTGAPDQNSGTLRDMTVSYGAYKDKIVIQWKPVKDSSYSLLRSNYKDRSFKEIAVTGNNIYEDKNIIPGIKYWYKVKITDREEAKKESFFTSLTASLFTKDPFLSGDDYIKTEEPDLNDSLLAIINDLPDAEGGKKSDSGDIITPIVASQVSNNYSGFAFAEKPKGQNLDRLIAMKKDTLKPPTAKNQLELHNKRLDYLKEFYMNPVQFSIIMLMARPYLNRGDLVIFTDLSSFDLNNENNTITFYDKYKSYSVIFESRRMLRIIREADDPELGRILLRNSELFCISSGKKEYQGDDGLTRIIYTYDAVGLSTRYLKNDAHWRSRTIMIATSRSDLKDQMMKASKPLE